MYQRNGTTAIWIVSAFIVIASEDILKMIRDKLSLKYGKCDVIVVPHYIDILHVLLTYRRFKSGTRTGNESLPEQTLTKLYDPIWCH